MKRLILAGLLICCVLAAGPALAEPMQVFVTIVPQKYFVDKIGGDLVEVSVMVPPGASPHHYEPRPKQMVALSKARIYFGIGVEFEQVWLKRLASTNDKMKIVHTEAGIRKIPMQAHDHDKAGDRKKGTDHDAGHDSDHGTLDPHVWTSPVRVQVIARNIRDGLVGADPAHKAEYDQRYYRFMKELEALDAELRQTFQGRQGLRFMVFHPAWGYLAHDYGLEQVPVEIEGKEPKPSQLQALIERARAEGIRVVFVQPQISSKSAATIAKAIGGEVVPADPLAADWGRNLMEQAARFKAALK
ncbi:MAG: zinc ABC transporter substrate-binding protein [Proteobacteria bacterium]|nr:zinc ABC transporter substrate-binding protein [Pseudomonadota bacterium]